ncbi:hypothetical protein CFC21_086346, partial [Triticum aestivum]
GGRSRSSSPAAAPDAAQERDAADPPDAAQEQDAASVADAARCRPHHAGVRHAWPRRLRPEVGLEQDGQKAMQLHLLLLLLVVIVRQREHRSCRLRRPVGLGQETQESHAPPCRRHRHRHLHTAPGDPDAPTPLNAGTARNSRPRAAPPRPQVVAAMTTTTSAFLALVACPQQSAGTYTRSLVRSTCLRLRRPPRHRRSLYSPGAASTRRRTPACSPCPPSFCSHI